MSRFIGRPLDRAWFLFLVLHLPVTLGLDCQAIYPKWLLAGTPLPAFQEWYVAFSRDPVVGGVFRRDPAWGWMSTFFYLELCFQVPCFVLGAIGLWQNDRRVYPLLLAYGASTTTTLLPTLHALLCDTTTSPPLTNAELCLLLSSYVPFLLIPLAMAVDMGYRLTNIVSASVALKNV